MGAEFPYLYKSSGELEIVTWADGTYEQLKAMLDAHDAGVINIYDYWSVGDEREVSLLFTTPLTVTMVLMNEGYLNINGIHFVVGQKDCLPGKRKHNYSSAATTWMNSAIRTYLNDSYWKAIPSGLLWMIKPFTLPYPSSGAVTDYVSLFAEKEIFGERTYSPTAEASGLSQIEYYETPSHRIKSVSGTASVWWTRSMPHSSTSKSACSVTAAGETNPTKSLVTNTFGVAPFFCI